MVPGDVAVTTTRSADDRRSVWHVDCFVCSTCRQRLVKLVHFWSAGRLYCGRHHAETVRPRCFACDEVGSWRRGVVASVVRRMNEVTLRRARLVSLLGGYTITVCNQPTRSTQPCIPPGSLNRVPASAWVKAGMSPLPGGR